MDDINTIILSYLDYPTYYKLATEKTRKYWMACSKCEIRESKNDKRWFINNKIHREEGPAVEYINGGKEWWINNKLHRSNGPAIESNDSKYWCKNGKLHRDNGPAIKSNGNRYWYINGEFIKSE